MTLVKIHLSSLTLPYQKPILVKEVYKTLLETLNLPEKSAQVLLYETMPQFRAIHGQKSIDFVYVEIITMKTPNCELKKDLIRKVKALIVKHLETKPEDVMCYMIEVPMENWE